MSFTTLLAVSGQVAADAGDDASQRLSYVIMGLVGLAVLIAVATIIFWRLSRPEPVATDAGIRWIPDPDAPAPAAEPPMTTAAPPTAPSQTAPSQTAPLGAGTGAALDPPTGR